MLLSDIQPLDSYERDALLCDLKTGKAHVGKYTTHIMPSGGSPLLAYRQIPPRAISFKLEMENLAQRAAAATAGEPLPKLKRGTDFTLHEIQETVGDNSFDHVVLAWEKHRDAFFEAVLGQCPVLLDKKGNPKVDKKGDPKRGKLSSSLLLGLFYDGTPLTELEPVKRWFKAVNPPAEDAVLGTCMFCGEKKLLDPSGRYDLVGSGLAREVSNGMAWDHGWNSSNYTCRDCWDGPVRNAIDQVKEKQSIWLGNLLPNTETPKGLNLSVWSVGGSESDLDLMDIFGYTVADHAEEVLNLVRRLRAKYAQKGGDTILQTSPRLRIMIWYTANKNMPVVDYITVPISDFLANVEQFFNVYGGIPLWTLLRTTASNVKYQKATGWLAQVSHPDISRWLRRFVWGQAACLTVPEKNKVFDLWISTRLRDLEPYNAKAQEKLMKAATTTATTPASLFGAMVAEYENIFAYADAFGAKDPKVWNRARNRAKLQGTRFLNMSRTRPRMALAQMHESARNAAARVPAGATRHLNELDLQMKDLEREGIVLPERFTVDDRMQMALGYGERKTAISGRLSNRKVNNTDKDTAKETRLEDSDELNHDDPDAFA